MRIPSLAAAALGAVLLMAGCGSKPYDLSSTTKVQPAAVKQPPADTAATSYTVCITGIGFQTTRTDATHIQTQSPSGRIVANSTILPTAEQATRFDAKATEPDHAVSDRLATVLVPDASSYTERQALLNCARTGGGGEASTTPASSTTTTPAKSSPATKSSARAPTKAAFLKEGNAICRRGSRKLDAASKKTFSKGRPTTADLRTFVKKDLVPGVQDQIDALGRLTPPKGDDAQVKKILAAAQKALDEGKKRPSSLTKSTGTPFAKANGLANKYGLKACGAN
jgi:hypothetical protein